MQTLEYQQNKPTKKTQSKPLDILIGAIAISIFPMTVISVVGGNIFDQVVDRTSIIFEMLVKLYLVCFLGSFVLMLYRLVSNIRRGEPVSGWIIASSVVFCFVLFATALSMFSR